MTHLGKSALVGLAHLVSIFSQSALRSSSGPWSARQIVSFRIPIFPKKSEFSGWAKVSDLAGLWKPARSLFLMERQGVSFFEAKWAGFQDFG
jgi:hypothetical protein